MGEPEPHGGNRDVGSVRGGHIAYGPPCVIGKIDIGSISKKRGTVAFDVDGETAGTRDCGDGEPVVPVCIIRDAVVIVEAHHSAMIVLARLEEGKDCIR